GANSFVEKGLADDSVAVDTRGVVVAKRTHHAGKVIPDARQISCLIPVWQTFDGEINDAAFWLSDPEGLSLGDAAVLAPLFPRKVELARLTHVFVDSKDLDAL